MATDGADRRLAAHGELELLRDFFNTCALEKGTDRIDAPQRLSAWMVEQGLASAGPTFTDEDVARARKLREAPRDAARQRRVPARPGDHPGA